MARIVYSENVTGSSYDPAIKGQNQPDGNKTLFGKVAFVATSLLTAIRFHPFSSATALGAVGIGAYSAYRGQFPSVPPSNQQPGAPHEYDLRYRHRW